MPTQINSDSVWVILFTSKSEDPEKTKGVDKEKCRKAEEEFPAVANLILKDGIKVGGVHICILVAPGCGHTPPVIWKP